MSQAIVEARANAVAEMEKLAALDELTAEQEARFDALEAEIADLDKRQQRQAAAAAARAAQPEAPAADDAELRKVAKPATPQVTDVRAVSPYAKENRNASWFRDLATLRDADASHADVEEARGRLNSHYESAADQGSSRVLRTYSAGTDSEGGYLVAPAYLQDQFVDLLAAGRPTADLVGKFGLPAKSDSINIPTQDGATAVAVHTENGAVTETTATFNTVRADVARVAGLATMPNFLLDRSLPGADMVVLRDLAKQYGVKVNDIVLNSSTSNRKGLLQESGLGAATATAGTATIASLWPALLNAVQDVASGVYAYPDAIIMHPRRWAWLAGQLDSNNRPVIGSLNPQNAVASYNGVNVPGFGQGPAAVGSLLGIPVYLDAGIPTNLGAGTDEDRIIVGRMSEAWLMETAPKFAVSVDSKFGTDQTQARVTGDLAFTCARRKAAFSIISGTALNDTI